MSEVWQELRELSFWVVLVFSVYLLFEWLEFKGWIRWDKNND
jgi:hypothetical protein